MKCEYCGTNIILQNNDFSQKQSACPKCNNVVSDGSWFCISCGEVLTKDVEHLKLIRKKVLFQQESHKKDMPEISKNIAADEYIYYSFQHRGFLANKYYVVTDKKVIVFENFGQCSEILLKDIVGESEPQCIDYGTYGGFAYKLTIQTFSNEIILNFGESSGWNFYRALQAALENFTLQKREIEAVICSLKIPD